MKRILCTIIMLYLVLTPFYAYSTELDGKKQIKGGVYTRGETDATIENAISNIPIPSTSQTITIQAGETLTAGQVCSIINEGGVQKAYHNPLSINTQPNGSEVVFNSAATTYCQAVKLDTTRFIAIYRDSDTYAHAIVGTVSGSSISWGSETSAFENTDSSYIAAALVATDKVLVAYQNASGNCRAVVLSVSTSTITVGTPMSVHTGGGSAHQSMAALDTDKAILCYRYADNKGCAVILTVSTTTPSAGTPVEFNANASYISVASLSSTSAIVAYRAVSASSYGTAQVLSISGTTITPGTEYVYESAAAYANSVCAMSSTTAVIACRGASNNGKAYVATIDGTAITYGSAATYNSAQSPMYNSISKISDSKFILAYQRSGDNGAGTSIIGTISGTGITFNSAIDFNTHTSNATEYVSTCYLGSNKTAIAYKDLGNSSYGTCCINTWATSSYDNIVGFSEGNYNSGSDAVILVKGISSFQSGLLFPYYQYVQSDMTLGTTPVSLNGSYVRMGLSKSSSEIILD